MPFRVQQLRWDGCSTSTTGRRPRQYERIGPSGPAVGVAEPEWSMPIIERMRFWGKENRVGSMRPGVALGVGIRGHCHIEQVEAVIDRGEARLRDWNRVAGLSPGRQ